MKTKTLSHYFLSRISSRPDSNCIGWIENDQVKFYSCAQYGNSVKSLIAGLSNIGLSKGGRVSILSHTCKEWHLMDMAIMLCNGATIPIYPNYISSEIEYIFNHSESSIIIVENNDQIKKIIEIKDRLNGLKTIISFNEISPDLRKLIPQNIKFYYLSEITRLGNKAIENNQQFVQETMNTITPTDIASIIYTSGTTGEPKGAVITQEGLCTMIENVFTFTKGGFSKEDRTLTFLPLSHVFGRVDSLLHLILEWEVVYAESIDKIVDNLSIAKPTIMMAVPRIFEKVYAKINAQIESGSFIKKAIFSWAESVSNDYFQKIEQDHAPSSLEIIQKNLAYKIVFSKIYERFGGKIRFFVSGGAPLSPQIIRFLRNANLTILEGYGLTETIGPCCVNPMNRQVPGTVGMPIGEVKLKFADDGEIMIKTIAMLTEYYKNSKATADAIKDGWFYTGDIGELTTDGYLKITDRKKDIIITAGGKNVAPQKIENMMKVEKYIAQFMVVGDKKKFLTGIVAIEKEPFLDHLEEWDVPKTITIQELSELSQVKELIQKNLDTINKKLSRFETIKKFYIAPNEWTVDGGQLTPSLKVKKKIIQKMYKKHIDAMYSN